jgi:glyoxylase-like metal-dependent hydrolase (beta-lactamase superfamily II)
VKKNWPDAAITISKDDEHMLSDTTANMSAPFGFSITAPQADETIEAGDELKLGPMVWRVLDTSGHTPGGVSFYCTEARVVITGDALFAESVGRTDIPGASEERQLKNIRENLLTLPDDVRVLPGHGPVSTIGHERQYNPFL